jgi:phage-related protein
MPLSQILEAINDCHLSQEELRDVYSAVTQRLAQNETQEMEFDPDENYFALALDITS